jgi:hypothetical protein
MVYLDASTDASSGGVFRAALQLSGVANGAIVVTASRYPSKTLALSTYITPTLTGTFPTITATLPGGGYWYFWLQDGDGETGPFGVDALLLCNPWLVSVGEAVRDILVANKSRLDRVLQLFHPEVEITTIEYGFANSQVNAPFIVVTAPRVESEPVALSNTYEYRYALTIAVVTARANDETDETKGAAALVQEIARILNQPGYSTIPLCDGCKLYFGHVSGGKAEMMTVPVQDGYLWFAVGDLSWSGNLMVSEGI